MLHELLTGLLGFPGDILVLQDSTMRVKDGFDLLTTGERDQVNMIAPLGWYYIRFQAFVDEYALQWGGRAEGEGHQLYRTAMSLGIADLLEEYTEDVVYLEQIVLNEGPIPLSQILLHLQKYLLCMPPIYNMLQQMEKKNVRGCRILDYLSKFRSGSPVVDDVVQNMLLRVRHVFLKQLVGWMIFGDLDDQGKEFFVQRRLTEQQAISTGAGTGTGSGKRGKKDQSNSNSHSNKQKAQNYLSPQGAGAGESSALRDMYAQLAGRGVEEDVLNAFTQLFNVTGTDSNANSASSGVNGSVGDILGSNSGPGRSGGEAFDWASTYMMRLDALPESHISAGLASKVMFAGKAVRLLQSVGVSAGASKSKSTSKRKTKRDGEGEGESEYENEGENQGEGQTGSGSGGIASHSQVGLNNSVYQYLSGEKAIGFKSVHGSDGQNISPYPTANNAPRAAADLVSVSIASNRATTGGSGGGIAGVGKGEGENKGEREGDGVQKYSKFDSNGEYLPASRRGKAALDPLSDPEGTRKRLLDEQRALCGYTDKEVEQFSRGFHLVLHREDAAVELLARLVEDVHNTISSRLWFSLRDTYGFHSFLNVVRNTFLMGKGELFQLILDGITAQTFLPLPDTRSANATLNWSVVRNAASIVGLDEDELAKVFKLRVNSYSVNISAEVAFAASASRGGGRGRGTYRGELEDEDACGIIFAGTARLVGPSKAASGQKMGQAQGSAFSMCPPLVIEPEMQLDKLFHTHILRSAHAARKQRHAEAEAAKQRAADKGGPNPEKTRSDFEMWCDAHPEIPDVFSAANGKGGQGNGSVKAGEDSSQRVAAAGGEQEEEERQYASGALWLSGQKNVVKGFSMRSSFTCDWSAVRAFLTSQHPWLDLTEPIPVSAMSTAGRPNSRWEDDMSDTGSVRSSFTGAGTMNTSNNSSNSNLARRSLLLGQLACTLHNDRQGTKALGPDLLQAVSAGATFHCRRHKDSPGGIQCFIRVYVGVKSESLGLGGGIRGTTRLSSTGSVVSRVGLGGANVNGHFDGQGQEEDGEHEGLAKDAAGSVVLQEVFIGVDTPASLGLGGTTSESNKSPFTRSVSGLSPLQLEVEYARVVTKGPGVLSAATGSGVHHVLRARVVERPADGRGVGRAASRSVNGTSNNGINSDQWDVSTRVELSHHVRLQGGEACVGLTSTGILLPTSTSTGTRTNRNSSSSSSSEEQQSLPFAGFSGGRGGPIGVDSDGTISTFNIDVFDLGFEAKGALAMYPVASPYTMSRHKDTFVRLEKELGQLRGWLGIQLHFTFPPIFNIIFDAEALGAYRRLFSLLLRIRLVAHSLERLWKTRSGLASDRSYCLLRHSMHFFISNLLYYLQVDVVDSEYARLTKDIAEARDFQEVLRAHRNFLSTLLRASLVDNVTVQDSIERVLQACLRFIAVCRLLHQQENASESGKHEHEHKHEHENPYDMDDDLHRYRMNGPDPSATEEEEEESPIFRPKKTSTSASSAKTRSGERGASALPSPSKATAANPRLPVVVPAEEMESVKKDFFAQISFLFQVMKKVENRGFMFRLDFNEFLSKLVNGGSTNSNSNA